MQKQLPLISYIVGVSQFRCSTLISLPMVVSTSIVQNVRLVFSSCNINWRKALADEHVSVSGKP